MTQHTHDFPEEWTYVGIHRGYRQYVKVCNVENCLECLNKYEPITDPESTENSWNQNKKENEK